MSVIVGTQIGILFRNKPIISNLSFSWSPGVYCLYGKNGRGKSTLLRIFAGAERNFSGSLRILDLDALKTPEEVNQYRAYMPDQPIFYPKATPLDLLSFVASVRKLNFQGLLDEVGEKFGLQELLSKPIETLSLGQRKRCFFAATLLKQVPIWILDEPTNGLDSHYRSVFFDQVNFHVASGGTVIIATHDLEVSNHLKATRLRLYPESLAQPVTELK